MAAGTGKSHYDGAMHLLFISDLHLDPSRPGALARFEDFLKKEAQKAHALYILGDLFEAWIGDDDRSPFALRVITALAATAQQGTALHLLHGNRDFLLGPDFAAVARCQLLPEISPLSAGSTPALLMHGDTLCTADTEYQALRQQFRDADWQRSFLARPLAERQRMAKELRVISATANQLKPEDITDADPAAVTAVMEHHQVRVLVHGHTHRPAVHRLEVNGAPARRFVLGAWEEDAPARCLRWRDDSWMPFDYPESLSPAR